MEAIKLMSFTEELVRLTLQWRVEETLEFDICLSKTFCSHLLRPHHHSHIPFSSEDDDSFGVPRYPLYKRVAFALTQFMTSADTSFKTRTIMPMIGVESSSDQKEVELKESISDKGSEIVNILKSVDIELDAGEPYLSQVKDGLKTVEGGRLVGKHTGIGIGNKILMNRCLVFEVQNIHRYASFSSMLEAENLAEVLPGAEFVKEGDDLGVQGYRMLYTEEKEKSNGVLAIFISKLDPQPHIYLAGILNGLSYAGVQGLLGLANTKGTIEQALPPPMSSLLSSFLLPYRINVKGSTLTHGARALAKHAHRSSKNYWGTLEGSDSKKNKLALDVITRLVTECCWSNLHIVPPHGEVFEIRVADGYGARWSVDGSKFIGFLEPYSDAGHLTGWKH